MKQGYGQKAQLHKINPTAFSFRGHVHRDKMIDIQNIPSQSPRSISIHLCTIQFISKKESIINQIKENDQEYENEKTTKRFTLSSPS